MRRINRVVITGIGLETPLGRTPEAVWEKARLGRSAISAVTRFDAGPFRSRIAAEVTGFDLVLASDVLYEKEYAQLLPGIFKRALAPGGMAIVADPGRIGVPEFVEECRNQGLVIRSKITHPFEVGEIKQKIDLYEIADEKS